MCVTVTHVDGVVLARSVFEHALNYRSAIIFGTPELLTERADKVAGMRAISEQIAPGQWGYAREPSDEELAVTTVLVLDLDEASVKVRTGPPGDGGGRTPTAPCGRGRSPSGRSGWSRSRSGHADGGGGPTPRGTEASGGPRSATSRTEHGRQSRARRRCLRSTRPGSCPVQAAGRISSH